MIDHAGFRGHVHPPMASRQKIIVYQCEVYLQIKIKNVKYSTLKIKDVWDWLLLKNGRPLFSHDGSMSDEILLASLISS